MAPATAARIKVIQEGQERRGGTRWPVDVKIKFFYVWKYQRSSPSPHGPATLGQLDLFSANPQFRSPYQFQPGAQKTKLIDIL